MHSVLIKILSIGSSYIRVSSVSKGSSSSTITTSWVASPSGSDGSIIKSPVSKSIDSSIVGNDIESPNLTLIAALKEANFLYSDPDSLSSLVNGLVVY